MKPRTQLLCAAALALGVAIGWPVAAHYRVQSKLAAYQRQLKAKGEKLTFAELTPATTPEGTWSANVLVTTANRLRVQMGSFSNQPPVMRLVAPGRALVGWQQEALPTFQVTNVWPGLRGLIAANQPTLLQAQAALRSPRLTVPLDYSQGAGLLLPHLALFKSLAQWLAADTSLALHEQRPEEAWESLQALVALAQRYQDEPVMISSLVRMAIGTLAVSSTWEALQSPDLQEAQLRDLQAAWSSMDVLTQAADAFSMERVSHGQLFEQGRQSYAAVGNIASGVGRSRSALSELAQMGKDVLDDPRKGFQSFAHRYPGYWKWRWWQSYEDQLAEAHALQVALETLRTIRQQGAFAPALQTFDQTTNTLLQAYPNAGQWLGFSLVGDGSTRKYLSRLASFETQRALVVAALALKRYQLRHGALPAQLSALVLEFLPTVPRDPVDGKPLRYRSNGDGTFLLYSVGEDGVDNGGDPSPPPTNPKSKNWLEARDVVWPAPASPKEVKAYFDALDAQRRPRTSPSAEEAMRRRYGVASRPSPAVPGTNTASK